MSPKSFGLWVPSSRTLSPPRDFSHHFQRASKSTFLRKHDPTSSRVSGPGPGWTLVSHQSALNTFLVCHTCSRESGARADIPPLLTDCPHGLPRSLLPVPCLSPPSPAAANTYPDSTLSLNSLRTTP